MGARWTSGARHLKTLEEIERTVLPGLVEVLRTEGIDGVRYALWDMTGWRRDYSPVAWRSRATEEQKRIGWGMRVRTKKIIATVLHEAHEQQQVEEAADALEEGPEGFYKSNPERGEDWVYNKLSTTQHFCSTCSKLRAPNNIVAVPKSSVAIAPTVTMLTESQS